MLIQVDTSFQVVNIYYIRSILSNFFFGWFGQWYQLPSTKHSFSWILLFIIVLLPLIKAWRARSLLHPYLEQSIKYINMSIKRFITVCRNKNRYWMEVSAAFRLFRASTHFLSVDWRLKIFSFRFHKWNKCKIDRTSCSILMADHVHHFMARDHPGQLNSITTIH